MREDRSLFGQKVRALAITIGASVALLLAAPLVPYKTVGVFLASILVVSGLATLLILAASLRLLEPLLFLEKRPGRS